ncbi:hypothetical protein DDZ13_03750 [Coraliomargarita sinensis]|uniref:Uncharacterized protein n=1 Tax=Coraliomargarita sinensis TaxID=2174842 RepID=A0A317ZMC7_9BACT|nr:DUF2231 domain-containing protein [Coraliomargarita sinensis]PXA05088.1 hypothetical protein DDZ13_03750 [Coraliomargarita sinensis]
MRFVLLTFFLAATVLFADRAALGSEANLEVLQQRAMAILKASCAECHDGTARRRDKGDFDHVLDVPRMIEGEYFLVPGDPMFSEIYAVMIDEDPDLRMPPPDNTDVHQPSEKEIRVVHDWIVALGLTDTSEAAVGGVEDAPRKDIPLASTSLANGAGEDAQPQLSEAITEAANTIEAIATKEGNHASASDPAVTIREPAGIEPATLLGRMHPLFVHFPVALLPMAGLIGLTGLILKRYEPWLPAIRWSLWLSALLSLLSVASGWIQSDLEGYTDGTVFLHRWSAVSLTVVTWLLLMIVEFSERKGTLRWRQMAVVLMLLAALLVALVGHSGGELVYGEGYLLGD